MFRKGSCSAQAGAHTRNLHVRLCKWRSLSMLLHFSHNPGRTTHSAMLAPLPAFPLALLLRSLAVAPMHVLRIQPLPPKLKVPFTRTSSPHSPTSIADPSPGQLNDEVSPHSVCTFLPGEFDSEHNLPLVSPLSLTRRFRVFHYELGIAIRHKI